MEFKKTDKELTLRERAEKLAATQGWTVAMMQNKCSLSNAYFSNVQKLTPKTALRVRNVIPNANIEYLNTGVGPILLNDDTQKNEVKGMQVPLLPISAQGGYLVDFEEQVSTYECEMIISPVKDATLAITVTGDSMTPEYPSGSRVLLRKINESAFLEWGKTFVLDTVNGAVIKNIFPSTNEDAVVCRSINPNYPDFEIRKEDVRGWYRVLMTMALK